MSHKILKFKMLIFSLSGLIFIFGFSFWTSAENDLEKLKESYFKQNQYSDFVQYLTELEKTNPMLSTKISYYIALTRYQQLKYLEETKSWDEYFDLGNVYRDQLTNQIERVINTTIPKDQLHIYAFCLKWRFHKDQNDGFEDKARNQLIDAVIEYAKSNPNSEPVKYVADVFLDYNNLSEARKLYNIYAKSFL